MFQGLKDFEGLSRMHGNPGCLALQLGQNIPSVAVSGSKVPSW